jgi:hypothetical protein
MTSSQHGPYTLGLTHATMAVKQRDAIPRGGANLKNTVSVGIAGCNSPA